MKDQDAKMFEYTSWLTKYGGFVKDMTLRDYFAAKAMLGLLTSTRISKPDWIANDSYEMADAMLKAREK